LGTLEAKPAEEELLLDTANLKIELLQVIDNHVRQVGTHCVFLQTVRPKWRRHDIIEIGSDLNQLYAHMEVSDFR